MIICQYIEMYLNVHCELPWQHCSGHIAVCLFYNYSLQNLKTSCNEIPDLRDLFVSNWDIILQCIAAFTFSSDTYMSTTFTILK